MPVPEDIAPEDSYVLDIQEDDGGVTILVEAALRAAHPQFRWPADDGEVNPYARLAIRLRGEVQWIDGRHPKAAADPPGEEDYGDLGGWWTDDAGTEHLDGEWGRFVVRSASQEVEVLPSITE